MKVFKSKSQIQIERQFLSKFKGLFIFIFFQISFVWEENNYISSSLIRNSSSFKSAIKRNEKIYETIKGKKTILF